MTTKLPEWATRLITCLFGGFVLALMVGKQHGTLTDFGVSFRQAVAPHRIWIFLLIGALIFAAITFWPQVAPYLTRPGIVPLIAGILAVLASLNVMNWWDPVRNIKATDNARFGVVRDVVDSGSGLSSITAPFFDYLAWSLLGAAVLVSAIGFVTRIRLFGYLTAAIGAAGAVLAYLAHADVVSVGGGIDHSLGVYAGIIGYLLLAAAGITAALSRAERADTRSFVARVVDFRPGLPLGSLAVVLGAFAFSTDGWFGTLGINDTLSEVHTDFDGQGLSTIAWQYVSWLGYALFAVTTILTVLAAVLRHRLLAAVAGAVALGGVILTFLTLHSITTVGADVAPQYGRTWKNLGAGGWLACVVFSLFLGAALLVAVPANGSARPAKSTDGLPVSAAVRRARVSPRVRSLLVVAAAVALFYPPMLTPYWQNVLVTQIGVFILLAIGLNVVVGWAGLLDLGYIAFFAIGSYTSAYLIGALPVKPPSWLHWGGHGGMTPLLTIPFAILACLIAGVLLGAPTLRLRGDYLAIVTLGFGEIVQIIAINDPGGLTGGPRGPSVPHPVLHIGGLHVVFGSDDLPFWYLLLVMIVVVIVLFYRVEGSRLGRAWAAIREDEVAAQATGVNTMLAKLLAFSIGASTSALAGVFFATEVGYFDPSLFTLQTSILIVAYVVFGGMGSLPGAMAGAAVLTWLPEFLKSQVPAEDRQMWIGALVLAMMIFRPAGLFPAKRRKAELEGLESPSSSEVSAVPASEGL
jgi:ABC-type branched-subunit amino acid transport system permease subunit